MGDKSVSDAEWILQLTFRFRGDGSFGVALQRVAISVLLQSLPIISIASVEHHPLRISLCI